MIFVNLLENSYGPAGRYYTYRLYSGDSEADLKREIVEGLKDSWSDGVDGIEELDSSLSLEDIVYGANDIIQEYGDLTDYDLFMDKPYTDINKAFDFYNEYVELLERGLEHYEEASFYFYGDYAISIQEWFPYLSDLRREYRVTINNEFFNRLDKDILQPSK